MSNKVSLPVESLAEKLKSTLVIGESGVSKLPATAFVDSLSEKCTEEQFKSAEEARNTFVAASVLAMKDKSYDYFKANPNGKEVTLSVNIGNDVLNARILREREGRNVQTGEPITTYGAVGVKYVTSARPNRGELKKVCNQIKEKFAGLSD